jgi:hypothetical protein
LRKCDISELGSDSGLQKLSYTLYLADLREEYSSQMSRVQKKKGIDWHSEYRTEPCALDAWYKQESGDL